MEWLIVQMWLWLTLASILGLVVGFWICASKDNIPNDDLDIEVAHLRSRCEEIDAEKFHLRAKVVELEAELGRAATTFGEKPTFYNSPNKGEPDNLQQIRGIGPKLEAVLHSLGVYYFDQISSWNDMQVDEVDKKLPFKGRIHRDNWRGQARELNEGRDR